jgi:anthranilate synthase/aminodeoxychorismate synthase-like glutamine amidotransferase
MILIIDNYDSFVHNLARYITQLGYATTVQRHDAISLDDIHQMNPTHIVISPGPCTPNEAGISLDAIKTFAPTTPILGICLGHQAIAQAFGGTIFQAKQPNHGKKLAIQHNGAGIFRNIPSPNWVGLYHSLCVNNLPPQLKITAQSSHGDIMAIAHQNFPCVGVQFHPESILTQHGYAMLNNFLNGNYR